MSRPFDEFSVSRRDVLKFAAASLTLAVSKIGAAATAAASILGVRVWPAQDYTRVTLEHDQPIRFTHLLVKDPERLVVDLEGVEFNTVLQSLPGKIAETDPYIKLIRAGRNKPGVVRIVIELKGEIKPQVFTLQPIGEYGHRLVLDLYPVQEIDPLMALLEKSEIRDETGTMQRISQSNIRFLKEYFTMEKIKVETEDLGGPERRKIFFFQSSGAVFRRFQRRNEDSSEFLRLEQDYINNVFRNKPRYGKVLLFD